MDRQQLPNQEPDTEDAGSNLTGDGSSDTNSESISPPGTPPPVQVESDDDEMAETKIGIPKFTGQETDVSDKARDWLTGLQTYFTKKSIGTGKWERRCGLI